MWLSIVDGLDVWWSARPIAHWRFYNELTDDDDDDDDDVNDGYAELVTLSSTIEVRLMNTTDLTNTKQNKKKLHQKTMNNIHKIVYYFLFETKIYVKQFG